MPRARRQADRRRPAHDADHAQRRPLPARPARHRPARCFMGMLHVIVARGPRSIATSSRAHHRVRSGARLRRATGTRGAPREMTRRAARRHREGGAAGSAESERAMALHARGIEHQSKGVENCLACINLCLATGNIGREGAGCMMITGQGNGQGGREHGQKCDQLPGAALDHRSRGAPARRQGLGHRATRSMPGPGLSAVEIMEAIHRGEIKALLSICFNPLVSLPDANLHARGAREARVLRRHRLLPLGNRAPRRRRARGQPAGGGRRRRLHAEGRVHQDQQGGRSAGRRALGRLDHLRSRAPPREGPVLRLPARTREIFDELRLASQGGIADYYGITWEKIEHELGVFWPCPALDHPGTPRLFEDGRFYHADGKAHFAGHRIPARAGDPVGRRLPHLPDHRPRRQPVPLRHADAAHRPAGRSVPGAAVEIHPRLAQTLGIADGDWVTVTTRRARVVLQAMVVRTIRPDTVFIPYHWPGKRSANRAHPPHARSRAARSPSSRCRPAASRRAAPPADLDEIRREETGGLGAQPPPGGGPDVRLRVLRRSLALHRLPLLRDRLRGVRHAIAASSMIHVDFIDRANTIATVPTVCMHCDEPTCALVCPADAIKKGEDGVVRSALKPRCIACSNCVLACPFGVPKVHVGARADDEVRHVLRPHVGRAAADVRDRLPQPGAEPIVPAETIARQRAATAGQRLPLRQPGGQDEGLHDGAGGAPDRSPSMSKTTCGRRQWARRMDRSTKPLWTEEFSVHASEDRYVLRRQFTKFLVLTSFGMAAGNAWIWLRSLWRQPRTSFPRMTIGSRRRRSGRRGPAV